MPSKVGNVSSETQASTFKGNLAENGIMNQLIREKNWAGTAVGSVETWSPSLKTAIQVVLGAGCPMSLLWGQAMTHFYNDAYALILGDRHPMALGRSACEVWADVWDIVRPQAEAALYEGRSTQVPNLRFTVERNGVLEEAYFTFCYSPIAESNGQPGGVLCTVLEATHGQLQQDLQQKLQQDLQQEFALREQQLQTKTNSIHHKIRNILERITDAFVAFDRDWQFTYVNRAAAQILQKTPEALIGKQVWQEVFPTEVDGVGYRELHRAMTDQVAVSWEEFKPPLGSWIEVNAYPSPEGVTVYFRDVTERKRAEADREQLLQALADERARFETVLRQMPAGVIIADAASNKLILANEQAKQIVGYGYETQGQALAPEEYERLVPFEGFRANGQRYAAHEYPLVRSLRSGETITDEEIQLHQTDDRSIFVSVNAAPILNHEGQIIAAVTIFQDVTDRKQTEAALRQNQERLNVALKSAPFALFNQDLELRYTWIHNPRLGYQVNEVIGKRDEDLVPSEDAAHLTQIKRQVLATGIGRREEAKISMHGQDFYFDLIVEPLRDEEGAIVGVTCASVDISERKDAEAALRESEERFSKLAEQVRFIPWEADPATGQFTYVGPQAVEILGYPLEDWYTENFWDEHIYAPDREWVINLCRDNSATLDNYEFEYRMVAVDSRIVWLYDLINVVREGNEPKLLRGIMIDITQRKRQEEAQQYLAEVSKVLSRSLDYQATLNQVAYLMVPHLADWCTVHVLKEDDIIQPLATAHVDPEKVKWANEINAKYPLDPNEPRGTAQVLRTGQSELYPYIPDELLVEAARDAEHLRLLRQVGFRSVMIVPMQAHGKTLGTLSFVAAESKRSYDQTDLALAEELARRAALAVENACLYQTAQQEREKAEAANRIKDEFLAILSHELRSPLNPILGWTKLLQTRTLDEATRQRALETIERNAKLQTQLIEDLLDVSRILRGKIVLNVCPVNLVTTIEAALETVRLAAETKNIQIQKNFAPDVGLVSGDSARLQQIIWNLLSNAVKFTPSGGQVEVRLERVNSYAQIRVQDTGRGISPEFLPHVFDYFRQEDGKTTRRFGGLGLGLAIVRHLTELHGGTIQAESPGEELGATFTVCLPLMVEGLPPLETRSFTNASADLSQLQVLVVDDEADMRELVLIILEQQGAQVSVAASAAEALTLLDRLQPDILLSDIGMPDMDGYMLMQQVRSRSPEQGGLIPAIALTAYAAEVDQRQALAAGFQQHIPKPVEPERLIQAIASLVNSA
jgi:PAS domain S-box-containing protein